MNGEHPAAPGAAEVGVPVAPIRLLVYDDLRRSRLTVFFRFLLALPHLFVLAMWTAFAYIVAFINWFAILFTARPVAGLHKLQVYYLRYFTHVDAYLNLLADPFPGFGGEPGSYPIDVELPDAHRQSRWKTAFRLILVIPAALLAGAFGAAGVLSGGGYLRGGFGIVIGAAFLGWFAALARGAMPQGLRDLLAYGVGYAAQVGGYVLLITDRYPNADPLAVRYPQAAPEHPIRLTTDEDLRRSRLTVFFRFFLALPHLVWLTLWGIAALFANVANWFVTLFRGRSADALHRFLSAYLRYQTHVWLFLSVLANPFPGFTGAHGSYPIDVEIAPPEPQNRWKTGFRQILVIPALLINSALGNAYFLVATFAWFTGLFLGRVPLGIQRLGVFTVRYQAQLNAYFYLLTDRYPFSGPSFELPAVEPPAPPRAPAPAAQPA